MEEGEGGSSGFQKGPKGYLLEERLSSMGEEEISLAWGSELPLSGLSDLGHMLSSPKKSSMSFNKHVQEMS